MLKKIQPFIQNMIETMSTVFEFEISVTDNNLERIAGTGKFKSGINKDITKSCILNKVIKTGKHYIVENPGKDILCRNCVYYNQCVETAGIAIPIFLENHIIGGIGLVSFDKYQRKRLLMKKEDLLSFIKHFSQLISSKVLEEEMLQKSVLISTQLRSIINAIDEGIIVIDQKGNIVLVNSYIKKSLDSHIHKELIGKPIKTFMPGLSLDKVVKLDHNINYHKGFIKTNKNNFKIIYSLVPVSIYNQIEGSILVFRLAEDAHKIAHIISEVAHQITFDDILGSSKLLQAAKKKAEITTNSDSTILLLGESGTGKELFARAIHFASKRNKGPLITINCAAIPDDLLESELFGYEQGAFTGAHKGGKLGKLELADKGTILLDEMGDMSMRMQSKILRTLEDKCIERVGGTKLIKVDLRIIAATSKNLENMVEKGTFRNDLYYRINTIPIVLPPLRERKEDIPIYLDFFRRHFNIRLEKQIKGFTTDARKELLKHHWPGNVREIKNVIEYSINMENSQYIKLINLPDRIKNFNNSRIHTFNSVEKKEIETINKNLDKFGETVKGKRLATREMGISLATLYRKIKKYNIC